MVEKIVFCTLRDNKGATGGPGGVLFLQKKVLGQKIADVNCEYWFNFLQGEGAIKSVVNKFYFFFKCLLSKNIYFFTHDITSGWMLSILGKRYSLVYHNQGPMLEELTNMGKKPGRIQSKVISYRERKAFVGATTLHFPSKGAADMYFVSRYSSCTRQEVNLCDPLYNIILPISEDNIPKQFELTKDDNSLTFFSLGTLTVAKGQDQSVEFLSQFLEYYKKNVRYIFVGKGPLKEQLISRLNEMKSRYTYFSYHYYDALPHDTIMYIHKITDIYLMLHRISIFDFATLEAMSQSTAIVLSKVGGNPEFNYENNIIYAEDAMQNMDLFSKMNFEELKDTNKRVFDKYFSEAAFIKQYELFIKDTISQYV